MATEGEHSNGEIRVPFGPRDNQHIPLSVASAMLRMWQERDPAHFGALLAESLTGVPPRTGRGRS